MRKANVHTFPEYIIHSIPRQDSIAYNYTMYDCIHTSSEIHFVYIVPAVGIVVTGSSSLAR